MRRAVNKLGIVLFAIVLKLIMADRERFDVMAANCKRQTRLSSFYLECSGQQMRHTIAEWPKEARSANISRIVANFNHNGMEYVAALPATDAEVFVSFSRNRIARIEESAFLNCANITSLDLSYNQLRSDALITNVFRGPYNERKYAPLALRALNLAHNELHSIGRNVFEHLVHLEWLDLSANRFRIVDALTTLSLKSLARLEFLNLASNRLIHLNATTLDGMHRLRTLDLSGNSFDFIPDAVKGVARTLTTLRIDGNPIVMISEDDLLGMLVLVELTASNLTHIEEVKTNAFRSLDHLRRVDLSMMGRKVALFDHLFGATLRELNLSHSHLEILSRTMTNWSRLTELDLRGNQLYCTCDLHNITLQLQAGVKRAHDGPFCFDYKRYKQYEVYTLSEEVCFEMEEPIDGSKDSIFTSERSIRMTLLATSVTLIVCLCVAAWMGYMRCHRRSYPFSTTVVYSTLPIGHL